MPLDPAAIHAHARQWFGRAPWSLARQESDLLVYWRKSDIAFGALLLLLVLGVVPAILCLSGARTTQTVTTSTAPAPGGADLEITVHPRGGDGRNRVIDVYNSLGRLITAPAP